MVEPSISAMAQQINDLSIQTIALAQKVNDLELEILKLKQPQGGSTNA